MSLILIAICLVVGLLIGAVGIGGVLLVPALSFVAEVGVHEAIPACMLSYLATGTIGVLIYARHGSIQWGMVGWLCLGAIPAAFIGSITLRSIPAAAVMMLIAVLMIFAGIDALRKTMTSPPNPAPARRLGPGQFIVIGLVTGFGSAITGTGGPLIVVPLTIFLGLPVLTAVGLSQAIQLPIATFASIGNWMSGNLNFGLAGVIACSMVIGALAGATLIHRVRGESVRQFIALLLIVVGIGIGVHQLSLIGFY